MAQIAKQIGINLIHISTDYVFDGLKDNPYLESILQTYKTVYGKQTERRKGYKKYKPKRFYNY